MTAEPSSDPFAIRRLRRTVDGLRDPEGSFVWEGGIGRSLFPSVGIRVDVERIRAERSGDVTGDVSAYVGIPEELISTQRVTLSGARARADLARALAARLPDEQLWPEIIDFATMNALQAFREGEPAIILRDIPRPSPVVHLIPGLILDRHPTVWFGDGGDGKSYLALAAAASIHAGSCEPLGIAPSRKLRVGWLDYEFTAEDHRDRLERLCGPAMPGIVYVPCAAPLFAEVDRLRRILTAHHVGFVVVDSIAFACDAPPETAEAAQRFYQALRMIGLPALLIAHTTKAESGDQRPFGSAFWHNGARCSWYMKASEESGPDRMRLGMFNRKANLGPKAAPIGFDLVFEGDRTWVMGAKVTESADLAAKLSTRARIAMLLRGGAMTYAELAAETGETVDTVSKAIRRDRGRAFVQVNGPDGITRWGLAA